MSNEQITALAAEFAQLKAELGAFGINLTPNAKESLRVVGERIATMKAPPAAQEKPAAEKNRAKLVGG